MTIATVGNVESLLLLSSSEITTISTNDSGIVFKDKKLNRFVGYTCGDIVQWIRYCHNIIGRPKNIVVYRFSRGKYNTLCPGFFKTL